MNEDYDLVSQHIINAMKCLAHKAFFKIKKEPERTTLIQSALSMLGDQIVEGHSRLKTYANRLPPELTQPNGPFKNREWLWDHHWFTELKGSNYRPTSLNLIAECQWRHKRYDRKGRKAMYGAVPYGAVKYNFQKLLVGSADLRVMIFQIRNKRQFSDLRRYFGRAIRGYRNSFGNSRFLFIAFDWEKRKLRYFEKFSKEKLIKDKKLALSILKPRRRALACFQKSYSNADWLSDFLTTLEKET